MVRVVVAAEVVKVVVEPALALHHQQGLRLQLVVTILPEYEGIVLIRV